MAITEQQLDAVINRSVTDLPKRATELESDQSLMLFFNQVNSVIEPWQGNTFRRDRQLRELIYGKNAEPFLTATVYSIIAARSALSWELEGTPKSVKRVQEILLNADAGKGWISLIQKVCFDLLVADNGAFIEVVRGKPRTGRRAESAPVIGLIHLDSTRCIRTNSPKEPVIYVDDDGVYHKLKWYQVITLEEMPVPDTDSYNKQVSFVSRVLNAVQIMQGINTHEEEKVTGRFAKEINLVSGVSQTKIEEIVEKGAIDADNAGLTRFMPNLILAALDPNAKISKETITFASLPEGFNKDDALKHYITLLALASGTDFQELAPLPGGNLGTASQSETLHKKSRVKGILLFIKLVEQKFHQARVIPPSVTFSFVQKDIEAEEMMVKMSQTRAQTRALSIQSGEITVDIARQQAVDSGDLKTEYLIAMGDTDITPSVTIEGTEPVSPELVALEGQPTPDNEKAIPVKTAWRTAQWMRQIIEATPIQGVAPISDGKLDTFTEALRNLLIKETVVYTDTGWQNLILTKAAQMSGIHPHVLRHRLPDNYQVWVTSNKVFDNRGSIIYEAPLVAVKQKVFAAQKAKGVHCTVCHKPHFVYNYMPLEGWVSSCVEHYERGLKGKPQDIQYTLDELLTTFEHQFTTTKSKPGLYLSTLLYAYGLGLNRKLPPIETVRPEFEKQQVVLHATKTAEPLKLSIMSMYYKGLGQRK